MDAHIFRFLTILLFLVSSVIANGGRRIVLSSEDEAEFYRIDLEAKRYRAYRTVYCDSNLIVGKLKGKGGADFNWVGIKLTEDSMVSLSTILQRSADQGAIPKGLSIVFVDGKDCIDDESCGIDSICFYSENSADSATIKLRAETLPLLTKKLAFKIVDFRLFGPHAASEIMNIRQMAATPKSVRPIKVGDRLYSFDVFDIKAKYDKPYFNDIYIHIAYKRPEIMEFVQTAFNRYKLVRHDYVYTPYNKFYNQDYEFDKRPEDYCLKMETRRVICDDDL